ncbi:MAG: PAS domain S-box protein [Bryobacteraceae bacterium]
MADPHPVDAEQRLQDLVESLNAIVWEADPSTSRVSYVSPSAEAILGYPIAEWYADADFLDRHIHPEDRPRLTEFAIADTLSGKELVSEFRMLAAGGNVVWFRQGVRVERDEAGQAIRVRGVMSDITIHRRAEETLRDSQRRYKYLVDHASDVILRTDAEGHFTYLNAAAPILLRRPLEELIGLHYLELVRPDVRPQVRRFYQRQFLRRAPASYLDIPVLTGDGSYIWVGQNVQIVLAGDRVAGFQAIVRDLTENKRAEERLRQSEERYRIVAETATDAIITIDEDSEIVFVNRAAEKIFGYAVEEMTGRRLTMLMPDYLRRIHEASFRRYMETGARHISWESVQLPGLHKDGREIPLELSFGEFTESGRHLFTGVVRDITERKRAEEALRRSDERFRSMIESAADVISIVDAEGVIKYQSPSALRVLGYRPEEVVGRSGFEIIHPDDLPEVQAAFERRLSQPDSPSLVTVCRARHNDGSWGVFEATARNLLADPSVGGIVVNLHDISDRKRAQEDLRAANETLRALIGASPLAIISVDAAGRVTQWNSAAERMFGWSEQDVLGRLLPYLPAGHEDESIDLLNSISRGETATVECTRATRDGRLLLVSISSAPLLAADGSICGGVAVITDITERRRLEEQVRQGQKMEAVGQLAGGVAHDFNNLLTVITGYDQLLMSSLPPNDAALPYAEEIMRAAERATSLTRQLLAFSRRQVVQPRTLEINTVVTNMTKMLRRLIGEHIELDTVLKADGGRILADPGQVEQIILNLAVNARDAMPTGGRVTIETADVQLGAEYARGHVGVQPGQHVLLAVTDTGHGMDAETRARIFEPFFTTKEMGKGTGLGLSTVYGVVKQSHANIWVYSEVGLGSTFKVYFPTASEERRAESGAEEERSIRGTETILVVEDEAGLRSLVRELLEPLGYSVLTAGTRLEAFEATGSHEGFIHLLLTDVVMPDGSGRDLAEKLYGLRPHMRVLYMSGYPDETIVRHGVLAKGVAFLQKPFTQETLAAKVREILDAPLRDLPAGA